MEGKVVDVVVVEVDVVVEEDVESGLYGPVKIGCITRNSCFKIMSSKPVNIRGRAHVVELEEAGIDELEVDVDDEDDEVDEELKVGPVDAVVDVEPSGTLVDDSGSGSSTN
jgi:hypothetical protein